MRHQIAVKQVQLFLDATHALRNSRKIYLVTRHQLQKMTTFGLAELNPRSNSRDLEGPRIHSTETPTAEQLALAMFDATGRTASAVRESPAGTIPDCERIARRHRPTTRLFRLKSCSAHRQNIDVEALGDLFP